MKVALLGAELEENLGLRYMASALENAGHSVEIIPFNTRRDTSDAVKQVMAFDPEITGLSMVFTTRAREFCRLAHALREAGYAGHLIAGGHFAALNHRNLLQDFSEFDSIAIGEGEAVICALANDIGAISQIPGLCYRQADGTLTLNPGTSNPENLDVLPFPKRITFHEYFDKPIASILSSRGCWRNCAFCSINAWHKQGGGKRFRYRSVENIVAEMKELYFRHGIRIFNCQDDNFFLPNHEKALQRFETLREMLKQEGVEDIAIAVKARPDSITYELIEVLDDLGLFRVFLGVENASERGLANLNRRCTVDQVLNALQVLNDFDLHIAYNLLMFEPDTTLDDILINLRFMENHIENPFNFCRAEAHSGTGLEDKLRAEGRLLGDYFGFDYRIKDPRSEAFHQIANYAFFDRNFSDFGLHYFNMQIDFYFQLLRRFHPELLTQTLRGTVRNFIKHTNLDTYQCLCQVYDYVVEADPTDQVAIRDFAREMRVIVEQHGKDLHGQGERILAWLNDIYDNRDIKGIRMPEYVSSAASEQSPLTAGPIPYTGLDSLKELGSVTSGTAWADSSKLMGVSLAPIPYHMFKDLLAQDSDEKE